MNTSELKNELDKLGVLPRFYSLDGSVKDECLILKRDVSSWIVYFSERGQKSGERMFSNQKDACEYILKTLSRDPLVKFIPRTTA